MKYFLCYLLVFCLISRTSLAQSVRHSHLLILTIHSGDLAFHPEIVVTSEDGQQVTLLRKPHWLLNETATKFSGLKHKDILQENEDSLYQLLKPYFDQGWMLRSTQVISGKGVGTDAGDDLLTRYFFTKQD